MFEELRQVLLAAPANASRSDYGHEMIEGNCLSKATAATRRLTNQRLGELYGLDNAIPLFRVLRRLWDIDQSGRPLLAILAAIARDPLLAATCAAIIPTEAGLDFQREPMKKALRSLVGDRLNERVLEKVCRNAASSWTQSGHLEGRTFKKRRRVSATPASVAFAVYLANGAGFSGAATLSSSWLRILDCSPSIAQRLALEAKQIGLLDMRVASAVIELNVSRLDPIQSRA